jgi:transposase
MLKINIEEIDKEANYTIKEVSKMFGVSYSAISAHIKRGNIASRTIFGKFYISGADLLEYINKK